MKCLKRWQKVFPDTRTFSDQSHVSERLRLWMYLDKLIRMDVVDKSTPINDENNRKNRRCDSDNLSLLYYKYIFKIHPHEYHGFRYFL